MTTINPSDFTVESIQPESRGGQHVGTPNYPVKVTHTPTGLSATAKGRSQHVSRAIAMEMIEYAIITYRDKLE